MTPTAEGLTRAGDTMRPQATTQGVVPPTSGHAVIDCTGYANVRLKSESDDIYIALSAPALDSETTRIILTNTPQSYQNALNLDGINTLLYLRAVGTAGTPLVWVMMW
jgi:hypothetical protein